MKKYSTNKNFQLLSILTGLILVLFAVYAKIITVQIGNVSRSMSGAIEGLSKLSALGSVTIFVGILVLVLVAALIAIAVQKLQKKENVTFQYGYIIGYAVLALAVFLSFSYASAFRNPLNLITIDGDSLKFKMYFYIFMGIVALVNAGYQLYLLVNDNKGLSFIELIKPNTIDNEETSSEDAGPIVSEETKQKAKETAEVAKQKGNALFGKIKDFLKTTKGKIITGAVVAVIIIGSATGYYFANKTTSFDPFKYVEVSYEGYDGEGEVVIEVKDSDKLSEKEQDLLDTMYFTTKARDVENGEEVTVKVTYNSEYAKQLKIDVSTRTKKYKVKGLEETISSYDDLDSKQVKAIESAYKDYEKDSLDEELKDYVEGKYSFNDGFTITNKEIIAKYFEDSYSKDDDDTIYYLMKIEVSGEKKTYFSSTEPEALTKTYYVVIEFSDISADGLKDYDSDSIQLETYSSASYAESDKEAKNKFKDSKYQDLEEFE